MQLFSLNSCSIYREFMNIMYNFMFFINLDVVFEVASDNWIGKKVIIIVQVVSLISRPLDILFLSPVTFPVVDQSKYEMDPVLLCFWNYEIQTLIDKEIKDQGYSHNLEEWSGCINACNTPRINICMYSIMINPRYIDSICTVELNSW